MLILAAAGQLASTAQAAATGAVGLPVYVGLVQRVSPNTISVSNPKDMTSETFLIVPKVTSVLWADGKSRAQMGSLVNGQFVKIYSHAERHGVRRAERIVILLGSRMNQGLQLR